MSLQARLTTLELGRFRYDEPGPGRPSLLPAVILRVQFFVPLLPAPHEKRGPIISNAVLATAEPFSIFPRSSWEILDASNAPPGERIEWLSPQPGYPTPVAPNRWPFRDRYPFRFGRIWAAVFDDLGNTLRAVPLVARFLWDSPRDIPEPLIGAQASVLRGRRLTRAPAVDQPQFNQSWWLEEENWGTRG